MWYVKELTQYFVSKIEGSVLKTENNNKNKIGCGKDVQQVASYAALAIRFGLDRYRRWQKIFLLGQLRGGQVVYTPLYTHK